jgi:hypothetical protein
MGWSDPVFGSLWLPKRNLGSLQPRKQGKALFAKCFARVQLRGRKEEEETYVDHQQPPQHVKREYELEEPVALVVEKYASFIDSTPDHVVNSALKMLLWKDKHFMNWRKQQQQAARKEVPITGTQKSQARA